MKQVIQNFKTGKLYVDEVPLPSISNGMVLVESKYSLISAGTEKSTVRVAQANLLGKAKQRPDLVAQVLQNIKKEGLSATIQKVRTKLDSLRSLGYSSSGEILMSLDTDGYFKPGDRVACAGVDYASHAEVISVPQNLVVRIPDNVTYEEAAFSTLGAIALQGIRQAEPQLGEKICVIGLGLLGQITIQMLKANGCSVFGIDFDESLINLSKELGADKSLLRQDINLTTACDGFTNGRGFDSVIITAATSSNDPIILATEILKKKGSMIVVGAVKMDIPREPHFYKKELELKISCSYGPGRYDFNYEEMGNDYPFAYVRWTEKRNMEAFLEMLSKKLISVKPLVSHVFEIEEAEKAYDVILGHTKTSFSGILLRYSPNHEKKVSKIELNHLPLNNINVGFLGAGSFAQGYLIPNVKSFGASLDGVVTSRGITSKNVADKFKFNFCSTEPNDVLQKKEINTIFIASPHSSHSELVIKSLEAGKNIFVEKPLAITLNQLKEVIEKKNNRSNILLVGYNRRFAPISVDIKEKLKNSGEPFVMNIRVNAGFIPKEHWTQIPEIGGGRIVGEICHFIDLMQFFCDGEPVKVFAESINSNNESVLSNDNVSVTVKFDNGSIGNLTYVSNGDKSLPKESIEIYNAGKIGIINDFNDGSFHFNNKKIKLNSSTKGHKEEVYAFLKCLKEGKESPINFRSLCLTTFTTFKILDSLSTGMPQQVNLKDLSSDF